MHRYSKSVAAVASGVMTLVTLLTVDALLPFSLIVQSASA